MYTVMLPIDAFRIKHLCYCTNGRFFKPCRSTLGIALYSHSSLPRISTRWSCLSSYLLLGSARQICVLVLLLSRFLLVLLHSFTAVLPLFPRYTHPPTSSALALSSIDCQTSGCELSLFSIFLLYRGFSLQNQRIDSALLLGEVGMEE